MPAVESYCLHPEYSRLAYLTGSITLEPEHALQTRSSQTFHQTESRVTPLNNIPPNLLNHCSLSTSNGHSTATPFYTFSSHANLEIVDTLLVTSNRPKTIENEIIHLPRRCWRHSGRGQPHQRQASHEDGYRDRHRVRYRYSGRGAQIHVLRGRPSD